MRAWIIASPLGGVDSDEAIVGLMARNVLDGDFRIYFWAQNYGGTQESIIAAGLFAVAGSSALALKAIPIALSAAAAVCIYLLGRETLDERAARFAGALFWAVPFPAVWLSTKERGFYGMTMLCGLVAMLAAVKLAKEPTKRWAAIGGFAAGFGVWASPQVAYLLLPAVIWLALTHWRLWRLLWIAIPAFVIGAIPVIRDNIRTQGLSFRSPDVAVHTSYWDRFSNYFESGLPFAFGIKVPYRSNWILGYVGVAIYVVALIVCVYALWKLRKRWREPIGMLLISVSVYPFVFALSPFSSYVRDPRYLSFLWAPFVLLLAWGIGKHLRNQALVAAIGVALCIGAMVSVLTWSTKEDNYDLVAPQVDGVIDDMVANGRNAAFGDYWIAYPTMFESKERILVSPVAGNRSTETRNAVRDSALPAYIFFEGTPKERETKSWLTVNGVGWSQQVVDEAVIIYPSRKVLPEEINTAWN